MNNIILCLMNVPFRDLKNPSAGPLNSCTALILRHPARCWWCCHEPSATPPRKHMPTYPAWVHPPLVDTADRNIFLHWNNVCFPLFYFKY